MTTHVNVTVLAPANFRARVLYAYHLASNGVFSDKFSS